VLGGILRYRWFRRGRGLGRGLGFGRRLGPNFSPYYRWFPRMPRAWGANSLYSDVMQSPMWRRPYYPQQLPIQQLQQNIPQEEYVQRERQPSSLELSMQSMPMHMKCVYFSDGVCTLGGMPVPPYGVACPNFVVRL